MGCAKRPAQGLPRAAATCETERPPWIAATALRLNASGRKAPAPSHAFQHRHLQALQPIRGVRSSGAGPVGRFNGIIELKLRGRFLLAQQGDAVIAAEVLNRMIQVATPIALRIA